jgi:predicted ATPase
LVLFNGATRLDSDPQGGLGSDNGPDGPFSMWTDLQDAEEQWCRRGAALVRLDADAIREPSPLLTNLSQLDLAGDRGRGLPGMLDYLRDRDEAAFTSIREDVYRLFPAVQYLSLKAVEQYETAGKGAFPVQRKVIQIRLKDGTEVDADRISEGLLYYLAYRALQHVSPAAVLLVEEPENGLHPARVVEVVGVLRKISEGGTQVVVATHSPLVVNELSPAEVSLVTRPDATGTVVTPIARTPGFDSRAKVYALGELWLNYADGKDESALINGGPRPGVLAP